MGEAVIEPTDEPLLVVLAAGLGTRFGGLKPLAPVGLGGEPIVVVGLQQAVRAGFRRAVVVVRADVRPSIAEALHRWSVAPGGRVDVRVEVVDQDTVGPPRAVPWGTVAAVLAGVADHPGSVVVANGDDLYGVDGLRAAFAAVTAASDHGVAWCVTYPFGATVLGDGDGDGDGRTDGGTVEGSGDQRRHDVDVDDTTSGDGVSRAVCSVAADGRIVALHERRHLHLGDLPPDTPVSMNLWAFGPGVVDELRRSFEAFVAEHPVGAGSRDDTNGEIDPGTAELGLPVALGRLVGTDAIVARSVPTTSTWLGVTWPDDVSLVRGRLLAPVAAAFGRPVPRRAERLGHGHIHVTVAADDVVYQRLNTDVFADVGAVVANAGRIHDHLARLEPALPIAVPEPLSSTAGPLVWHDGDGEVWRAARRITGVESTLVARSPAEAFEAARAFGALTRALDDLDGEPLVETIAGFHDFAGRRAQMERAVEADREHRMAQAVDVVAEARVLAADVAGALVEAGVDDLSRRVVHNDAKIANVLFAAGRADSHPHAVAVVDLDTTWSATVLADLGELLRTGGTAAAEDEPDLSVVTLDERLLTAIVRGYLAGLDGLLTPAELDALDVAGAWLATENGLRFLTDHLDGDRYFGVSRTHHNLDRARAQLRLGRLLLDARTRLAALLHEDRP